MPSSNDAHQYYRQGQLTVGLQCITTREFDRAIRVVSLCGTSDEIISQEAAAYEPDSGKRS